MARPEITKTPLGERLRLVRNSHGDPARSIFAGQLETNKTSLGQYERGDTLPNADVLCRYRVETGINLNWLLTGYGEMFDDTARESGFEDTMADRNDSEAVWDRSLFQEAMRRAKLFESKQGGKKFSPNAMIELIDEIYQELQSK